MRTQNSRPDSTIALDTDDQLGRAIIYSIAFHVAVVVALTVRAFFFPSEPIRMEHAIRVDIVGLPDKPIAKLPPPVEEVKPPERAKPTLPEPKPEVKPEPAPKVALPKPDTPKVNLNKTKQEQQAALKRLEAIEKLQKMANNAKPSHEAPTKVAVESPQPVRGNEVSQGSALKGLARLENENYTEALLEHITRHWNLPQWMANANLSATVQLFIDAQGNVLKKDMTRSSGNPVFDERVMRAIESSMPLPRPPGGIANLVAVRGVQLEFTPEH